MRTVTIASVAVDDDAIKQSIATSASPVTYSGADLNGVIGADTFNPVGRRLTITTTTHAATYNVTDPIVITGTDMGGNVLEEEVTLAQVNGNETKTTTAYFSSVTSIEIPAQADTLGTFKFGVAAGAKVGSCEEIRCAGTGTLEVTYADGSTDTITSVIAGEHFNIDPNGFTSNTTVTGITIFLKY